MSYFFGEKTMKSRVESEGAKSGSVYIILLGVFLWTFFMRSAVILELKFIVDF